MRAPHAVDNESQEELADCYGDVGPLEGFEMGGLGRGTLKIINGLR